MAKPAPIPAVARKRGVWLAAFMVALVLLIGIGWFQPQAAKNAVAEAASGFVQSSSEVLKDTKTGLYRTQADNGADIDWGASQTILRS